MSRISSHEAAWVAELLILLPDVEILSVDVVAESMQVNGEEVPVAVVQILAPTLFEADELISALHLTKVESTDMPATATNDAEYAWHQWRGWAHEGSRQVACQVKVTAAELRANGHEKASVAA